MWRPWPAFVDIGPGHGHRKEPKCGWRYPVAYVVCWLASPVSAPSGSRLIYPQNRTFACWLRELAVLQTCPYRRAMAKSRSGSGLDRGQACIIVLLNRNRQSAAPAIMQAWPRYKPDPVTVVCSVVSLLFDEGPLLKKHAVRSRAGIEQDRIPAIDNDAVKFWVFRIWFVKPYLSIRLHLIRHDA